MPTRVFVCPLVSLCVCVCVCVCVCAPTRLPELAGNDETAITDYQAGFHQNHSSLDLSCFFSLYKALTEPQLE